MQTASYQNRIHIAENIHTTDCTEVSILKVLAYFDIFQYPLTKKEIKQYLDKPVTDHELERAMQRLLDDATIFRLADFYSLQDNLFLAEKRAAGNLRAERMLQKAARIGKFLFQFPFVRAIGISGSLSKNFADEKADINFFIITKSNRLWIARTFMHIFKKFTFCTGKQHMYCMNYYIDEESLGIDEKNIFTALEIKTLLPICGITAMDNFFVANSWTHDLLPACSFRQQVRQEPRPSWLKQFTEWIFNNKMGNRLDDHLARITSRRWKKKEQKGKLNEKGQPMGLITGKHFARSNPDSFQEKVLSVYSRQLSALGSKLPHWFDEISLSFSA